MSTEKNGNIIKEPWLKHDLSFLLRKHNGVRVEDREK